MNRLFTFLLMAGLLVSGSSCHTACHRAQRLNGKLIAGKNDFGKTDTKKYRRMNRRAY